MIEIVDHPEGVLLAVMAHPGARRAGVLGERSGALRVAVTAAPDKGKANAALEKAIAQALDCRPSQVALESGQTSRRKRFLIRGIDKQTLVQRLAELVRAHASIDKEQSHDEPA